MQSKNIWGEYQAVCFIEEDPHEFWYLKGRRTTRSAAQKKLVQDLARKFRILDQAYAYGKRSRKGKLLSSVKRRRAAEEIQEELRVSDRPVCSVLEEPSSTQLR